MPPILDISEPLNLPKVTREVENALNAAQNLIYDAWEAPSRAKMLELARKALAKSPYCVDAYNIFAQEAETHEEALKIYERAEEIGKKYLGKKFFRENMGIFWGILETRPYMRAKNGIALSCRAMGDRKNAITQCQEMLELCENDNLGMRDLLFPMLIEEREFEKAEILADKYDSDFDANWLYGRVLLEFAKNGPDGNSVQLLANALKANKEAAKYLSLKKKMPANLPWSYSLGSKEEAVHVAYCQLEAWKSTENACEWLAAQIASRPRQKKSKD